MTPTKLDEQARAHSAPPPPTIPRCDSETEFPSLRPSSASSARASPPGTRTGTGIRKTTLRYNLIARRGLLAAEVPVAAPPRRDDVVGPQWPASTGTSTAQQPNSDSDSWRRLPRPAPAVPIPGTGQRQGRGTDAAFPPLISPATASATTATTNRSGGASWSTSGEHSPSSRVFVFRREVEEISFEELSLLPSPSRASNSFHQRFQSST
ncbi:hypothetical protein BJV78DRAFT_496162 [Lactifluus subvellereus]|nr:hypothetical protein BJV78DRAFT_496162 [Lactifluus subvellereus]